MNDQEKYLFDLQGFLLVENALTEDQVKSLNGTMDEKIRQDASADMRTHRFGHITRWSQEATELIANPRITPYLRELLGDRFRLDHDYADVIRSGKGPIGTHLHGGATPFDPSQYYRFQDGRMHNGLLVVAYNLHSIGPGEGGFGCVPGSHKSNYRFPDSWRDLENLQPFMRAVTGPAGSAVIFTEALTHGTLPWNASHERRTLFLKYCPHPLAWSRFYYDATEYADLSDEARKALNTPGVYPPA